jgi:hypothetical protein
MTSLLNPATAITTAYGAPLAQHRLIGQRLVAGAIVLGLLSFVAAPLSVVLACIALLGLAVLLR